MFTYPKTKENENACIGKQIIIRERLDNSIMLTQHTIKGVEISKMPFVNENGLCFTIKFTLDGDCFLYVTPISKTYVRKGFGTENISVFAASDYLRNDFIAIANDNQLDIECSLQYIERCVAHYYVWDDETNSVKCHRHYVMPSAYYYELGDDFKLKLRPLEISYGKGEYATAEECKAANIPDKHKLIATAFLWRGELGLSDDDLKSLVNEIL